jgi:integrase
MKKGQNFNKPSIGSMIKVGPIKKKKDINAIKKILSDKPRDFALFVFGINTNLRAGDLLKINAGMVRYLKPGESFELKEQKTGKIKRVTVNKTALKAVKTLLRHQDIEDDQPLFQGQRGPLTVPSVTRLVKNWCKEINLKGNYGSHTLRKTWGYHQRVTFGSDIPTLMVCFNHSNQRQTLDYLCIQPKELKNVYENEL